MSDEQFNGILANIRKENKLDTEEQFQAALKQEGLTIPELRKAIEKQMLDQPRAAAGRVRRSASRRRNRAPTSTRTRKNSSPTSR